MSTPKMKHLVKLECNSTLLYTNQRIINFATRQSTFTYAFKT